MSRRLDFSYRMELDFSMPAQNHQFTLRIVPHSDERQRITACEFSCIGTLTHLEIHTYTARQSSSMSALPSP